MAQRSKAYRAVAEKIDFDHLYTPLEAIKFAKEAAGSKKFNSTVDVAMRLGVDPRKADRMVRGTVNLPHGTGKTVRVLVFAQGEAAKAAKEAGADFVGADDLIGQIDKENFFDFDIAIATPDMMGKVGRVGRKLGPRGLMPNPKSGTIVSPDDLPRTIREVRGGRIRVAEQSQTVRDGHPAVDQFAPLVLVMAVLAGPDTELGSGVLRCISHCLSHEFGLRHCQVHFGNADIVRQRHFEVARMSFH